MTLRQAVSMLVLAVAVGGLAGCADSEDVRLVGDGGSSGNTVGVIPEIAQAAGAETVVPVASAVPTVDIPPTATPDPFAHVGAPVQLAIPAIGVTALVEQVGLTKDGAMDTPRGWMNVGWFSPGFRPGEVGNAVIAGHLDSRSGGPAVFWSLSKLQPGDEITVTYANGDRYTFAVQDVGVLPYDVQGDAVTKIFGPSQTPDLNLITCNGEWDRGRATYTKRLVVYTTLLPEKTVRAGVNGSYD
jgi:sortase (surface protein transpeptidase)